MSKPTLGDIITEVRNRADLTNSQFITDEELTSYINYSTSELAGLMVNSYGGDYFASFFTGSVMDGDTFLNTDFPDYTHKILGVDLCIGGFPAPGQPANNRITLQPFNFNERNRANSLNQQGYATQYQTNYRYNIKFKTIMLQPPAAGQVDLLFWYVPTPPQFLVYASGSEPPNYPPNYLDQEFSDLFNIMGWLEYVTTDVCIKCKEKEETDASMFVRQKALLTERIRNESNQRDQGSPAQVSDVYAVGVRTDLGWNGGGFGGPDFTY